MDLQEIVRRLRMNQSIKAIKRETGRHRSVIRRVRELAEQEGWLQAAELPGERQLRERYHEQQQAERGAAHPLDAHRGKIAGWLELKEPYSFLVIHKLLTGLGVEYSETTVRRYIHRHFPKAVRPVMRRRHHLHQVSRCGLPRPAARRHRHHGLGQRRCAQQIHPLTGRRRFASRPAQAVLARTVRHPRLTHHRPHHHRVTRPRRDVYDGATGRYGDPPPQGWPRQTYGVVVTA